MHLPVAPQVLHGIELRSISRQKLDPKPPVRLPGKIPDHVASMTFQPIPYDEQVSSDVPHQMSQKVDYLRTADRPRIESEIKIPPGDPRHGRELLPIEMILQHGGLSSRRPGPTAMRLLAQSALVNEHYRAALPLGFFLSSGQRFLFQRWTAASSLSKARPTGLWQLHPSRRNSHPTCSGVYRTPKRCSISAAIRRVVHRPVSYPKASGPRLSSLSICRKSRSLKRGLRPGRSAFLSPARPNSCKARFHRFTDWRWTPTLRATSASCTPFPNSAAARNRRFSSTSKFRLTPIGFPMHRILPQISTNVTIISWDQ